MTTVNDYLKSVLLSIKTCRARLADRGEQVEQKLAYAAADLEDAEIELNEAIRMLGYLETA